MNSCASCQKKEESEIVKLIKDIEIPEFPNPYNEYGVPYLQYQLYTKKVLMDEEYYIKILAYGHKVEAAAQALEELKK